MSRVLGRVRLSKVTDATTSPERQRAVIEQWAAANGHQVIGWATDLDVSRSVNPLEAPDLGPWLRERAEEFDIVACWKLDRLAVGSVYLSKVMEWAQQHGKTIVSVTESFDLSTWVGRMVASLLAGVAEGELEAIRERNAGAFEHNYRLGKWRGGVPPLGYKPEKVNGEWRLVPDPEMAPVVREIVDRLVAGQSLRSIRLDLNERGIPSPRDHFRKLQGREPKGEEWHVNALKRALRSPALLGQVVYRPAKLDASGRPLRDEKGNKVYGPEQVLRDDSGAPVVRAEPLIDRQTFDRLQVALKGRSGPPKRRKNPTPLLLQVIFCGVCGRPMYRQRGRNFDYYRCSSAQYKDTCGNGSIRIEAANEIIEEGLLGEFGDIERRRKVWEPGTDVSVELAEIDAELTDIAGVVGTTAFRSGPARDKLRARIEALEARRQELETSPVREPGYRFEPTGETFAEYWSRLDADGRNVFLRDNGIRFEYTKASGEGPRYHVDWGDLESLLHSISPDADPEDYVRRRREASAEARRSLGM